MARSKLFTIAVLSLILITGLSSKGQVGIDVAKDFTVKDVNSITHHLFNYLDNDKIVVIDFFTTNCGPCQTYASHVSQAYEYFGCNEGNVIFLGINWGSNNDEVRVFDSIWGAHYPSVSGLQGGGDNVVDSFQVLSYPTVAIITPDHQIAVHYIWPPSFDSIQFHVLASGGIPSQCTISARSLSPENPIEVNVLPSGELAINASGLSGKELLLSVYSITGQLINETTFSGGISIPINYNKGVFLGLIKQDNKILGRFKFIIP